MQRRAFEVSAVWDDVEEHEIEMDPPPVDRLTEITAPTLVLLGGLDLDTIHRATACVVGGIANARRVDWPDVAHLPSMERPDDFLVLLLRWIAHPDGDF